MDVKGIIAAVLLLVALILGILSSALPDFAISTTPPVSLNAFTTLPEQKMSWGVWDTCWQIENSKKCTGGEPVYMSTAYPETLPAIQAARAFYVIGSIACIVGLILAIVAALQSQALGVPAGGLALFTFICYLIAWDCMVGMLNTRYKTIGPSVMEWKNAVLTLSASNDTVVRYIVGTTTKYSVSFILGIVAFVLPVPAMVLLCMVKPQGFTKGPALMSEHM